MAFLDPTSSGHAALRIAAAFVAGVVGCSALVLLCHLIGIEWGFSEPGYRYSGAVTSCYVPVFLIGGPAAAM